MAKRNPPGRKKGTPKTGGRKKGTPNKATLEAKEACALIVDDPAYRKNLLARAKSGKLAPAVETMVWAYAKGKPKETVEINASLVAVDTSRMNDKELAKAIELGRQLSKVLRHGEAD